MDELSKSKLKQKLNSNQQELFIMSPEEFEEIKRKVIKATNLDNLKAAAGYVSPALDVKTSLGQIRELGPFGRVVEKVTNGRRYVIFKGYPGLRKLLKGTRYAANNPKVVSMAIGRIGVAKSIAQGAKLTVFLTVPINIFKYLIDEQSTLGSLVGTIATDLVKLGISAALGAGAALAIGAISTVAAGPLIAAIFVGIATSIILEKIDAEFGLTEALIKFFDDTYQSLYDQTLGALARQMVKVERILVWQAKNKIPVGKGIFY